jgi:signal peptidase I
VSEKRKSAGAVAASLPHATHRASMRENLESIALAILLVLVVRQLVVEAFKIPTGSMAPTLLGIHKEVRCPNCGWTFRAAYDKFGPYRNLQCPNCMDSWPGGSMEVGEGYDETIVFRRPAWLWNEGWTSRTNRHVYGIDAANRVDRWGSRIFVNKFIYELRKPRRWEVIVFLHPYADARCLDCQWEDPQAPADIEKCPLCGSRRLVVGRKNYIKRLVGLPGERIVIENGDVYINGQIARKPPGVQECLWQHVLDSSYVPRKEVAPLWDFGEEPARWKRDTQTGALALAALDAESPPLVGLARPIGDFCAYNGSREGFPEGPFGSGKHDVGDCRLDLELTVLGAKANASVVLRIEDDEHDFLLRLPAGRAGKAELLDAGRLVAERPFAGLTQGAMGRVVLENYDDLVSANVNGQVIMSHPYEGNPRPARRERCVAFGARGAQVAFHRVRVARDIYYLSEEDLDGNPRTYQLDDRGYFVLGDNSAGSYDSRLWPSCEVPAKHLMGEAFAIFWPIHDISLLTTGPE